MAIKHSILLAMALAVSSCGVIQLRPASYYEWYRDPAMIEAEYYRWETVGERFADHCGFHAHPIRDGGKAACVVQVARGVIHPGDREIATGILYTGEPKEGRLCVVFATHDEDTINATTDKSGDMTLAAHEVGGHCRGFNHWPVY